MKYSLIAVVALLLISGVVTANFIFWNEAPITSGRVDYGISYKNDLKLDIYRPTKQVYDSSPVIFYIHGGAWIGGTKAGINFNRFNGAVNTLRENGYTIICPDYSLAGQTQNVFPDCILDLYEAIEWTKRNAKVYGLDTTNMGLLGESAGAHIAMMVAFPDTTLLPEKYSKTKFRYLIDVYGPNDLTDIYRGKALEQIEATTGKVARIFGSEFNIKEYLFGFDPVQDSLRARELLNRFSPIRLVAENDTPVLIIHGTNDRVVPVAQSIRLKSTLDSLGMTNEMHLLDSVDHTFVNATDAQRDSVQSWIAAFVRKN